MSNDLVAVMEAIDQQDYEEAVRLLRPLAVSGNPNAQNNLGTLYQLGLGVERDLKQAAQWFLMAVESGDGAAAHNLGTIYLLDDPAFPADKKESDRWYKKALELGFKVANSEWYEGGDKLT